MIREYQPTSFRADEQDEYKEKQQELDTKYGIQQADEFYGIVEEASEDKERMMEGVD